MCHSGCSWPHVWTVSFTVCAVAGLLDLATSHCDMHPSSDYQGACCMRRVSGSVILELNRGEWHRACVTRHAMVVIGMCTFDISLANSEVLFPESRCLLIGCCQGIPWYYGTPSQQLVNECPSKEPNLDISG